ncbi:hypothetical protein G7Z17_g12437 [Cylindrodendrum hubeiense]|uniref:Uncharacterized protein n=1 Tax=Cylindrodendrum hubeiense TaxID=595255 RepID=A0A9P5GZ14_9HYPO|nr:hypothetical protein G7Z17_g12437 [Cylindrodendrum hubeiense]
MESAASTLARALLHLRNHDENPENGHGVTTGEKAVTTGTIVSISFMIGMPIVAFLTYLAVKSYKARRLQRDVEQGHIELEVRDGQDGRNAV